MNIKELSLEQLSILQQISPEITENEFFKLVTSHDFFKLDSDTQLTILQVANAFYRQGYPIITDSTYNSYLKHYSDNHPNSDFVNEVEPEFVDEGKLVKLPQKMLSTDKAYSKSEIEKWVSKILKAADEIGVDRNKVLVRVTPKLDGFASYDDGVTLYTRGDGLKGQDITRAIDRGLQVANSAARGLGAGEIVTDREYFNDFLSEDYENTRNIQSGIIAEKNVDPKIQEAINVGACVFYPFSELENWTGLTTDLLTNFDSIVEQIWNSVSYDVDGVILEATDTAIKEHLGATRKFHRWQIAFKVNDVSAQVSVIGVTPQTSRTGRVNPVAELVPTKISGATISRATAHHYGMVKACGVGKGAILEIVRSGLVIPKIEHVLKPVSPDIPSNCPSCNSELYWSSDYLYCSNKTNCPAQAETTIVHFFKSLGNIDGFGPKVVEKLLRNGVEKVSDIYKLTAVELQLMGFGQKTSANLIEQLDLSRRISIEDWRFLSAFGITRMGAGNCEKLLQHHSLSELYDLTTEDISAIRGFGKLSALSIVSGLNSVRDEFIKIHNLNFQIEDTLKHGANIQQESPLTGTTVVFTGTMTSGSRSDMEKYAKSLGANVAKSVSGKTTYLVAGLKVGESKISAARDKGVKVLTESEYLDMIKY